MRREGSVLLTANQPSSWDGPGRITAISILVVLCQVVFILVLANYFWGGLRFTSPKANYLVFAVASGMAVAACIICFRTFPLSRFGARMWIAVLLGFIGLLALFLEMLLVGNITGTFLMDTISERVRPEQILEWNGTTISVWRDMSSEDSSRIVVQDTKIAGPLVRRRELARFYLAMEVTVTPVDAHRLRCKVREPAPNPPYDKPVDREVVLTVD